jgi:diphthamide synthase subunit DPH2
VTNKTICICSSANFYKHAYEVSEELKKIGFKIKVPITIRKMKQSGNYNAADYRTWYKDPNTYKRKTYLMKNHFAKIAASDAILVVNDEKNGVGGYLGANVLMEMGLAFYLKKPIFILGEVPQTNPVYEEVMAMNSSIIYGDLGKIKL